jgi:hypothetical protein
MKESLGGLLCAAIAISPLLVVLVIWLFFRSAVRSGVQGAAPTAVPVPPPAAAGLTEQAVREIVRDELRRIQAARAAARPSPASPGSAPPGAAGIPRKA